MDFIVNNATSGTSGITSRINRGCTSWPCQNPHCLIHGRIPFEQRKAKAEKLLKEQLQLASLNYLQTKKRKTTWRPRITLLR